MLVTQYTSSKEIINNFFRNTNISERVNYGDMAFWIFECMGLINHPLQYIPRLVGHLGEEEYALQDYKIKLPVDFHKLSLVAINNTLAIPATDGFHYLMDGNCCDIATATASSYNFTDNFGNTFSPNALPINTNIIDKPYTFHINDNYITFNVNEGNVCMAYLAFPLDEEGFPMIPDDVKYKRACSSYLQYKTDYILWRNDLLNNNVYLESKQEWEWAVASAAAELKMPDQNQMETFKNSMLKMVVRTDEFQSAFRGINYKGFKNRY